MHRFFHPTAAVASLLLGLVVPGYSARAAQEPLARINLHSSSQDAIDFEIIGASEGGHAEWVGQNWQQVMAHFSASGEWRTGWLALKPTKDGRVSLLVMGPWIQEDAASRRLRPVMIEYDNFVVEGATLGNPGFEETHSNGDLANWYKSDVAGSNPPITPEIRARAMGGDASEGTSFIRVWHNSRFGQSFTVTAAKPIKITFSYRLAK